MIDSQKILALIPARGGSKGLPRKNILPLSGKPLIAWTVEAAKNSKYIDNCIVSTDDIEIAECAEKYGAEIPFLRPPNLATDFTSSNDVILHAIENIHDNYDLLVLLQPTSPLRTEYDIDNGIEKFLHLVSFSALLSTLIF